MVCNRHQESEGRMLYRGPRRRPSVQGSTSVFTSWPTHGDTELMEWLLFLLTHAAWCPVLSGEHLSGEASGHQASNFQRMGLHGPASLSPEHWASSSPSKARGPSHRLKLGNSCLALPWEVSERDTGLKLATQKPHRVACHSAKGLESDPTAPVGEQDSRRRSNWFEDKTKTQTA